MRKIVVASVVVIVVLAAAALGVGLWITRQIEPLQVSFDGVSVKSIGLTSATLNIRLKIYNPNTMITATLLRADYDLYGNNIHLGNGVIPQRVDIPAGGTRTVATDFDLSYSGAARGLWSALKEGGVSWRITGTAYFDTPIGTINVPFDIQPPV